ncbi:STAS domain-containing protein [Streptomyces anandii]|uniref:Anti-sigma factor antagonist n=1 Tax=Streptomyces anandii TaxID=285454 RepID=A0ABW6HEA3_9ACTN
MDDDGLVVALHGEIDHDVKDLLSVSLLSEDGTTTTRIMAALGDVTFMDSSGINAFVTVHRRANAAQGRLRIAGAQEPVVRLLHMVGIDEITDCHPLVEQGLNA